MGVKFKKLCEGPFENKNSKTINAYAAKKGIINLSLEVPVFSNIQVLRNFSELFEFNSFLRDHIISQYIITYGRKKKKLKIDAYGKEYKYICSAKNTFIPIQNKSNVNGEVISLKERLESIGFVRVNLNNSKIHSSIYIKVIDASGRFVIAETYLKNRNDTTKNRQLEIYDLWGLESDVKIVIKQINKEPIKSGVYTCR